MTVTVGTQTVTRADGMLWRDTGRHVVTMLPHSEGQVRVLGGGSAAVWRLLEEPLTVGEIVDRLAEAGPPPALEVVAEHVQQLCHDGILSPGSRP